MSIEKKGNHKGTKTDQIKKSAKQTNLLFWKWFDWIYTTIECKRKKIECKKNSIDYRSHANNRLWQWLFSIYNTFKHDVLRFKIRFIAIFPCWGKEQLLPNVNDLSSNAVYRLPRWMMTVFSLTFIWSFFFIENTLQKFHQIFHYIYDQHFLSEIICFIYFCFVCFFFITIFVLHLRSLLSSYFLFGFRNLIVLYISYVYIFV